MKQIKHTRPITVKMIRKVISVFYQIKSKRYQYHYKKCATIYGLNPGETRPIPIVASLTTFPARIESVALTIKSLMDQSMKPDKIVLYLGEDVREVPDSLEQLKPYGLEIHFVPGNLKPHKKYFYALEEYPEAILITADDDIMYDRRFIEVLYACHLRNPGAVVAHRVHKMLKQDVELLPYAEWSYEDWSMPNKPSFSLFATGCAGVLYPPGSICRSSNDLQDIVEYCLNADDVWLKFKELEHSVPVVWTGRRGYMEIREHQRTGLAQTNVNAGGNDSYIDAMQQLTGILLRDYAAEN